MGFMDFISTSATSLVIGGNTGINPCLTLFMVGCLERINPDLLHMDGTMESLLSSWPGLIALGIASCLEFIGNCVPILDQVIDSAMTFIIPIMSVAGSLSTFGLFSQLESETSDQGNRMLGMDGSGLIVFFQVILVICGIGLALALHLFKMFVRLLGEGCLTGLLSALEVMWTFCVVTVVIFIQPIAIVVAVCLCWAAALGIKRKFIDKKEEEEAEKLSEDDDVVIVEEGYVQMEGEKRPVSPVSKDEDDVVIIEQGKGYSSMDAKV